MMLDGTLRASDPETEVIIQPSPELLEIDSDPPSVETLKNGKAPGIDQIYEETLKANEQITPILLTEILHDIRKSEDASLSWKAGPTVKLPKKGDPINCKRINVVVGYIQSPSVDPLLQKEQACFR